MATIKERLIERFKNAKEKAGSEWKAKLIESDSFYNSYEGAMIINQTSVLGSRPASMNVDKLERITLALEEITGTQPVPVV